MKCYRSWKRSLAPQVSDNNAYCGLIYLVKLVWAAKKLDKAGSFGSRLRFNVTQRQLMRTSDFAYYPNRRMPIENAFRGADSLLLSVLQEQDMVLVQLQLEASTLGAVAVRNDAMA